MTESLSQQEIDALFSKGPEPADRPETSPAPSQDVQLYDFGRPARISKDRKRSLMAIYDVLSKSLEGWFTGRCRDPVELEIESVEALTFGEFTLALRSPCVSYVVDINGKGGQQGVVDLGHEFAFFLVDRLLGGGGTVAVPDRGLTPLERLVVRIVAERIMSHLSDAWKDYVQLDLAVSGFESIPEMLQVANREDPVLVAQLQVRAAELTSTLLVSLPFNVLEKFFTGDTKRRVHTVEGSPDERAEDRRRIGESLVASKIDVAARLPSFGVPLGRLADLKAGQTLHTGLVTDSGLEVLVDGQRRFDGAPGRVGRQLAVRITGEAPAEIQSRDATN